MDKPKPTILIIFGITGDLALRKLLPAVGEIISSKTAPEEFKIIGITRQANIDANKLFENIKYKDLLKDYISIIQMDLDNLEDYKKLAVKLDEIKSKVGDTFERLFYLSVPPKASQSIIRLLGESGLSMSEQSKLLIEKPFGRNASSSEIQTEEINKYFKPSQVYRIDHYLAKKMSQNIIAFRRENSLFKNIWNNNFIERIEITAGESIGIEGRLNFYEQAGALRDVAGNHLLQLAAITMMDMDNNDSDIGVSAKRLEILKSFHTPSDTLVSSYAVRGQYESYKNEVNNPKSAIETFVSFTILSDHPRWSGVPIKLTTGKMLDKKNTEVRIVFKELKSAKQNSLIFRFAPNESIELGVWSKEPGYDMQTKRNNLTLNYTKDIKIPEAYERILLDAINSNSEIFISSEEVMESWRIVTPIQIAWEGSDDDLILYKSGAKIEDIYKSVNYQAG